MGRRQTGAAEVSTDVTGPKAASFSERVAALLQPYDLKRFGFDQQTGIARFYTQQVIFSLQPFLRAVESADDGVPVAVLRAVKALSKTQLENCTSYQIFIAKRVGELRDWPSASDALKASTNKEFIPENSEARLVRIDQALVRIKKIGAELQTKLGDAEWRASVRLELSTAVDELNTACFVP